VTNFECSFESLKDDPKTLNKTKSKT